MAKAANRPVLHVAEPPPAFLGRPPMVVDCSVLSAVLFAEDLRDDAMRIIAGKSLHAPFLLDTEFVSVAIKKSRAGWPGSVVGDALARYAQQQIELHRADVQAQYALALRYGLSAYDAAYLWLAGFLQAPLATFDAKLAKAARAYLAGPA
ncbi:MAG TPA: type II toxin-antitoxin system VapC family toxin [Ramlibacter sp.]|uniref:type II toxin-antitoxin system VapC family toxin n=1 Tax=Ramlibacter sp. TaxID=1917967 RepID=UPI002D80854E|nr:type II toxin-antitoxin system VapC family toxin [Ramlibacter sp.]HET8747963.1 type II toxin-antitoxin system VapC family toxin [Ramlibacter sp.]